MKSIRPLSFIGLVLCLYFTFSKTAAGQSRYGADETGGDSASEEGATSGQPAEEAAGSEAGDAAAEPAAAQTSASPCDRVSCSNHGTCVERDGAPYCACEAGFAPDAATGLSCLPAPTAPPPVQPVLSAEALQEQAEMEEAVSSVATVISPGTARRYYFRYKSHLRASAFDGTYHQFLERTFAARRTAGIVFLSLGACLAGGAAAFFVTGVNNVYRDEELASILLAFGIVSSAAANVFLIMGAVKIGTGGSRLRKLRRLQDPGAQSQGAVGRLRLSPYLTRSSDALGSASTYGLAAHLTF